MGPACLPSWQPYHHTKIELTPSNIALSFFLHWRHRVPVDWVNLKVRFNISKHRTNSDELSFPKFLLCRQYCHIEIGFLWHHCPSQDWPPLRQSSGGNSEAHHIYDTGCQWSYPDTSWQASALLIRPVRYTGNPTKTKFTRDLHSTQTSFAQLIRFLCSKQTKCEPIQELLRFLSINNKNYSHFYSVDT